MTNLIVGCLTGCLAPRLICLDSFRGTGKKFDTLKKPSLQQWESKFFLKKFDLNGSLRNAFFTHSFYKLDHFWSIGENSLPKGCQKSKSKQSLGTNLHWKKLRE
jgi:hypothetical protein